MTSEAASRSEELVHELSDLDQRAGQASGDVSLLRGMRDGIRQLIDANDGNTAAIRSLLEASCERGELRRETFELVSSMLESHLSENIPTAGSTGPDGESDDNAADDAFASTMVISPDAAEPEQPERRLQIGSVLRDRFLLQEQVSGGSMGVVYKALDRRLAETGEERPHVAIKVISPVLARDAKALRALQQEAAKGRCLVHNHIVRFIDFDREDDLYFIVMEWLDGENLADMLDRGESIDATRALNITRQIGQALDYAHRCGIVHADIKPANVMILPNGDAKLFDFGVARARQSAERSDFSPAELGAITPAYSSMQVLTGEEPVPEDDVFSLACLYYRLVAGYRVFGPRNAAEAAEAGMAPQPLQGLSGEQWKAVKKALSFARVTRYKTVGEFLADLEPAHGADVDVIRADRTSRMNLEPSLPGTSKVPWFAVFVIALLAAAGAAYYQGMLDPYLESLDIGSSVDKMTPGAATAANEADAAASQVGATDTGAAADPVAVDRSVDPGSTVASPGAESDDVAVVDDGALFAPSLREQLTDDEAGRAAGNDVAGNQAARAAPSPPPGDVQISLGLGAFETVTMDESAGPLLLDLIRTSGIEDSERVFLEIVEFSGNRSPLETGDLLITPVPRLLFDAGSDRLQIEISMRDDPLREADQSVFLLLRSESGGEASVELRLQDDDQRRFEAGLPANTVAFAAGQVTVEERDAAVQLDVVRFKPDAQPLTVFFTVSDVTATADEDYFPPARTTVEFAPGQRSARILVPLVQDTEREGNEAFVLELVSSNQVSDAEIYQRIAVMIRDDD